MVASTLSFNSAEVSWTGTAANYVVAYGTGTNPDLMDTLNAADTTIIVTGLTAETTYNFFVKSVCGTESESYWSLMASAYTGYCSPNPTSIDGSGITNVTFGTGSELVSSNPALTSSPYYSNNVTNVGAIAAGTIAAVDITFNTGYDYGTVIWVDWNNNLTFDNDEVVYTGTASENEPTTLHASFAINGSTDTGYYRMRIAAADSYFDNFVAGTATYADPCFTASYSVALDYTIHVTPAPACMPVTGVTVSNTTNTSAVVTWTPIDTTVNNFVVAYGTVNDIDSMTTTTSSVNTITLNGLASGTTYYVAVKSVCSADDQSDWTNVTTFFTNACADEDMCSVTFVMQDSYGDGWNGGFITVVDSITNATIATLTVTDDYNTVNVPVCPGRNYQVVWNSGMYDSEVSFVLNDNNGRPMYSVSTPNSGVIYSFVATCITLVNWNVTVATNDTTLGTVTGSGIYTDGDTATLVATPALGCRFVSWNDGDTNATRQVIVMSDATFTATFAYLPLTVVLENSDTTMGYITPAAGTYQFEVGDTMMAMAYANTGYNFVNWTMVAGSLTDTSSVNPISEVVPVYMAGLTITISANWAPNTYTITALSADTSLGTVTGSGMYAYNTTATITATPAANCHFVAWNDGNTDATRQVLVLGDETYTATFASDLLTVNLSINDEEMGSTNPAPGTYTYAVGDTVHAEATANEGYRFVEWQLTLLGSTSTWNQPVVDLTIPASVAGETMNVVAVFEQTPSYTLTVVVKDQDGNEGVGGTATGDGVYLAGSDVALTATAAEGYTFSGWMDENGTVLSVEANYTMVMPEADATVFAVFSNNVSIDELAAANISIISQNGNIVVRGAENQNIRIFDVVGRMVAQCQSAAEVESISVSEMGVYLVQVGNYTARKVVVRR